MVESPAARQTWNEFWNNTLISATAVDQVITMETYVTPQTQV